MERRDDPRGHVVDPDACAGSLVGMCGEELRLVIGVGLLKVFENDSRFVERLGAAVLGWAGESRD